MSDNKKQLSLMAILTACAVFVALVSFILPLFSINFIGIHSYSGCDAIRDALSNSDYPEFGIGIAVCLIFTILSIICSLMALKDNSFCGGTIVTSAIGMLLMIVAMSGDSDILRPIDYAAIGFYLYEMMSFAAIVLSAASLYLSKNAGTTGDSTFRPVSKRIQKPDLGQGPVPPAKVICPNCKRKQAHDAAYCRFCGTAIARDMDLPPEKVERKAICPYCGARQREDAVRCKYCGTPMK